MYTVMLTGYIILLMGFLLEGLFFTLHQCASDITPPSYGHAISEMVNYYGDNLLWLEINQADDYGDTVTCNKYVLDQNPQIKIGYLPLLQIRMN